MSVTWEQVYNRLNAYSEEITKQSKRVLKREVPKGQDIRLEITDNLVKQFNSFAILINKNFNLLNDEQQVVCEKLFDKIRDKVLRAFQVINCRYTVPKALGQLININVLDEVSDSESEENMALSMNEFFNLASKIVPSEFNGDASKLQSFTDALELLRLNAANHEDTAILFVKTRLTGKARSLITNENTLADVITTLKHGIKGESSSLVMAKLGKFKQIGKDLTTYATGLEKLMEQMQAAYRAEGMPANLVSKYTTEAVTKSIIQNAASESLRTIIAAGNFSTPQDVITKLVSVDDGTERQERILNFRANQYPTRGNYNPARRVNQWQRNRDNFSGPSPNPNNYRAPQRNYENGHQGNSFHRGRQENWRNRDQGRGRFNRNNRYTNVRVCDSKEQEDEVQNPQLGF